MKKTGVTGVIIIVLLALLLACAPKAAPVPATTPTPTPTTKATPAPTPTAKPTPAPTPAAEGPVRGGVLKCAALLDPPSFDSMAETSGSLQVHIAGVFSGLLRTDPMKTEVSPDNMISDLAEKWEISPDGKTYTFYLRHGVKWHDGQPFTAKDIKYSLDKFRDPSRSSFAANVSSIDSVDIVDDYTVKLRLKQAQPEILVFLAPPYASMQAEHLKNVNPKSTDFLVGTGPFKFKQFVPGKLAVYERNPDYFIKGLPYLDGYEVYILTYQPMVDAFITGQLDVCGNLRSFFATDVPLFKKVKQYAPEAGIALVPPGSTRGIYFGFNHKGPWNDVRVRKAMSMVLESQDIVIAMVGGLELGYEIGAGALPFYLKGAYTKEEVAKALGTDKPLEQRIANAKELMKEAGYPNGFSGAKIIMRGDQTWARNTAGYCAGMWKKYLNIDTVQSPLDTAMFFPLRDKGDFDLLWEGNSVTTGVSIGEFLNNFKTGAIVNHAKWSNPEFDRLTEQLTGELDQAKRIELARKAQAIYYEELPYMPLAGQIYGVAWRPDLMTGWPPKGGIVIQPLFTTINSIDRMWFKGTPDAARWTKAK